MEWTNSEDIWGKMRREANQVERLLGVILGNKLYKGPKLGRTFDTREGVRGSTKLRNEWRLA